jgi:hypothetical protein
MSMRVPPGLTKRLDWVNDCGPTKVCRMVTVNGLGMVTVSQSPLGVVPPHVLGSFQFPLLTAVNPVGGHPVA